MRLGRWRVARRALRFGRLAEGLGWSYAASGEGFAASTEVCDGLARLPVLDRGHERVFRNVARMRTELGKLVVADVSMRVTELGALSFEAGGAPRGGVELIGARGRATIVARRDMTLVALRVPGRALTRFEALVGASSSEVQGFVDEAALAHLAEVDGVVYAVGCGDWVAVIRYDRRVPVPELADFMRSARRFACEVASRPNACGLRAAG